MAPTPTAGNQLTLQRAYGPEWSNLSFDAQCPWRWIGHAGRLPMPPLRPGLGQRNPQDSAETGHMAAMRDVFPVVALRFCMAG